MRQGVTKVYGSWVIKTRYRFACSFSVIAAPVSEL